MKATVPHTASRQAQAALLDATGVEGRSASRSRTVIRKRRGWQAIDLGELWQHRELLYFFTWRDVVVKYKQTVFGTAWTVVQPLMQMAVFSVLFGRFLGLDQQIGAVPYPVFVFAGLLPWTTFAKAMGGSGNAILASSSLITKVYFPRLIVPIASVGATVVDFLVSFVVLAGLMLYYGVVPGSQILLLPVLVVLIHLASLSIGIAASALVVRYRDVRIALPFLIQIWMYFTPVIYPVTIVPERFRWLMALNPMTGLIDGFRYCLLGQAFEWHTLLLATGMTLVFLVASVFYFRRVESTFVDII